MSRKNRRDIRRGRLMRASDVAGGAGRRARDAGQLLPCLAIRPMGSEPVDAETLSRELVHLFAIGRRASSS